MSQCQKKKKNQLHLANIRSRHLTHTKKGINFLCTRRGLVFLWSGVKLFGTHSWVIRAAWALPALFPFTLWMIREQTCSPDFTLVQARRISAHSGVKSALKDWLNCYRVCFSFHLPLSGFHSDSLGVGGTDMVLIIFFVMFKAVFHHSTETFSLNQSDISLKGNLVLFL